MISSDMCITYSVCCVFKTLAVWSVAASGHWLSVARSHVGHRQYSASVQRLARPRHRLLRDEERGRRPCNVECHDGRCSRSARWHSSRQAGNGVEGACWNCSRFCVWPSGVTCWTMSFCSVGTNKLELTTSIVLRCSPRTWTIPSHADWQLRYTVWPASMIWLRTRDCLGC